ncbi:MFS transporter [Sphaerisporangium sp. TRM90804]|uniref:MFS transporter n=1 Tax=Sphaerisporangium sp. TRM90804 TaxID=3031113 RepID=UPI00244B6615|nr:MFS transporter [Sphaerisporangium sp. TRM90804]MDH2430404.1 MFS transporter [Sphaerisporangium sp. TRM90804]
MAGAWERTRSGLSRAGSAAAGAGRRTARAGRAATRKTGSAGRAAATGAARAGRGVGRATRRLTHAQGADRTGLGRLIELTAVHGAGDTLITVALAGTLLFGLPVDQARGQVALYLLITMLPFAVVAPFVGPVLDRFRSGRRYVMAGTLFARGLLCWAMAAAIGPSDAVTLFPAALAVLVLSKAYSVSRAATMPSVLPADISLVTANARVALFSLVAAGVAAPVAVGLTSWLGADWVLRGTMVVFLAAGVGTMRLPRHVDAPDIELDDGALTGERSLDGSGHTPSAATGSGAGGVREAGGRARRWRTLLSLGPVVTEAMWANAAVRVLSGFLLFFLLFLVQEGHLRGGGLSKELTIAVLAGGAGAGGLLGAVVASWIRGRSPQLIVLFAVGLATAAAAVGAVFFGLWAAVVVAAVAGFTQEVGKLALDAIVQREIGEEVRSSTFGVVEALLQIAWVGGGLAGLLLSLLSGRTAGPIGLAVVTAGLLAALAWLVTSRRRRLRAAKARVRAEHGEPHPAPSEPDGYPQPAQTTKPLTNPHG